MKIEILNRFNNSIIFSHDVGNNTVKLTVLAAIASNANLRVADLSGADLRVADLSGADLRGVDLRGANLRGADLSGADLSGANLSEANLREANLSGANLSGANLSESDLREANLRGADLRGADLSWAKLCEAKLCGAKYIPNIAAAQTLIVADGQIIGWKKCQQGVIVKLSIPAEARRSNATGRKCRAEFADVLEVIGGDVGISSHDGKTKYIAGTRVTCDEWCEDRWQECAGGIHFFITRAEAEAY
jgi:hypothetical protein